VALGVAALLLTEALSPLHLLRRVPLAIAWTLLAAAAAYLLYQRRPKFVIPRPRPIESAIALAIFAIACLVGIAAALSPPNSADAMAYHMPRVVYWAQAGSVAFFPTPYLNQIMLQPLNEYLMLHTYVLSGGDRFINLLTFAAFLGCIMGVSALAGAMRLGSKGQAFAAFFCATLPSFILQASGAKNDSLLSLWLVCLVYFGLRGNIPFTALALALALATKGTAYLFAPPLLAALLLFRATGWKRLAAWSAAAILLLNGPQYARNLQLSGSPLGFDSAQGDGVFRWRNEHPGLKSTVSNLLRNTSEQLGDRRQPWNQAVYRATLKLHAILGLDPRDPATTWPWVRFDPPLNANHEANANNRWHLLLLLLAALFAAATRRRFWCIYAAALFTAFLLFCFYLKWQPYLARLELPLFVLAAPLAALLLDRLRPRPLALLACLFLLGVARNAILQNWTRPLKGPHNLFVTARDDNYFNDMVQFNNRASYLPAVTLAVRSGCRTVGIDITRNQLEYPFQALLLERAPLVRFVHTGVANASARYAPANPPRPCAVVCLDCAGHADKIALYRAFGPPVTVGTFLWFER
jgi:hypothetical protein